MKRSIIVAAFAFGLAACEKPALDFRAALDTHLAAIDARDLDAFTATITSETDLMVIFPHGATLESTSDVVAFHENWFSDTQWVFEPEVVKTIVGKDMATALIKYDYRDTADGDPRSRWLVLVFKLEAGEWRLVHDQNTHIDEQTEDEDA